MIRLLIQAWLLVALGFDHAALASDQKVLAENAKLSNESLLWGPYRPNLYFGVRPRIPKSFSASLLWSHVGDFQAVQNNFRWTCEQNEAMAGYGWDEYDARAGGRQTIHDAGNFLDLTTDFVKIPGGSHGGSWGVRVKGVPRKDAPKNLVTAVVFSASMEGIGSLLVDNDPDPQGFDGTVTLKGETLELGSFQVDITRGPKSNKHPPKQHETWNNKPLDRTMVASLQVPEEVLWQSKPLFFQHVKEEVDKYIAKYGNEQSPPPWQVFTVANRPGAGNLQFVQKVFTGAFEFDVLFSSGAEKIASDDLTKRLDQASKAFNERFEKILAPKKPYGDAKYMKFAKSMFSNLLGGVGYFSGDIIIDRSYAPEYEEENEGFWQQAQDARARAVLKNEGPHELFTSIPSRPFFPRGFLWDEGFHLLPIAEWDMDLTLGILRSWLNLMDDDGWIAREVILGDEARSKVPPEFTVQYPHFANPPTLFLILEVLIDKLEAKAGRTPDSKDPWDEARNQQLRDPDAAISYLRETYPQLRKHYLWYKKTQSGDIKSYDREAFSSKEAYRWRGRNERHTLPSGLDDYPRAQPPHPGELHVDLISWMGMVTRLMKRVAKKIGDTDDGQEYQGYETAITRNIDDLHWSAKDKAYCDATIDAFEEHVHVCHKGYLSLFPFMTGLIPPDDPKLAHVLDLIKDPKELWSDYGIRSLSQKDELYGTDENYWRSPVWMNMNYLILKNLRNVASVKGPQKEKARHMYNKLRKNLVENVFEQWEKTGFAWEQYNPETGDGQRTQHFTGWTSLVVNVMAMGQLGKEGKDEL